MLVRKPWDGPVGRGVSLSLLACLAACGTSRSSESTAPGDVRETAPAPTSTATSSPSSPDAQAALPMPRYQEVRGVMHVHSAFSHDACDEQGLSGTTPNAACVAALREAPCKVGLQFVGLTDHPAHMREFTPKELLLFDAAKGDELVLGADGSPVGNKVKCANGQSVLFTFGYESTHTLPIALERQPTLYEAYTNDRTPAQITALVSDLKAAGAVVGLAHSEEADMPADLIVQGGADVMEWYNPHGNFKTVFGGDKLGGNVSEVFSLVRGIDDFLKGSTSGAHPDLIYLRILPSWPKEGFDKWRTVQRSRHVPGILGSDVHQNVSVDPVCKGTVQQALCQGLAGGRLAALALLAAGGQLIMSDNQRMDSYERIMRWLHNRILVDEVSPKAIADALRNGRSYGLFSVFGEPVDFSFVGRRDNDVRTMGEEMKAPAALQVRVPQPRSIVGGATFDAAQAAKAELRVVLFRTDASGTTEVARTNTIGSTLAFDAKDPGSYHIEIWVKPKHLTSALGGQSGLADAEYLWLITNPLRVTR